MAAKCVQWLGGSGRLEFSFGLPGFWLGPGLWLVSFYEELYKWEQQSRFLAGPGARLFGLY